MNTDEVRRRFLGHFEANGHTVVPSAPLPFEDPNLLFINAGMVQFVPYFVGQQSAPWPRATSIQKCIRTLDIDEVGKTTRHGTFFQMAGNFSFGDYFKAGAIDLAWRLSTNPIEDGGYGLDGERIWVTVFPDDQEAIDIWHNTIGIPMDRIVKRGMDDNFWSMGIPGPCGPCSELYYDRGPDYGEEGGPDVDEDRYLEFWNLVFMQNERGPSKVRARRTTRSSASCRPRTSTPAWAWSGWPRSYRASTTSTRSTRPGRSDRAAELAGKCTARVPGTRPSESAPRRRPAAGDRRPRQKLADADRRRGDAGQRGPGLCAASAHPARRAVHAAPRLRRAQPARAAAGRARLHGAVLPGTRQRLRPHQRLRLRRRGRLPGDPARRHVHVRPGGHRRWPRRTPRRSAAIRPSCCTTPTASRSTSPSRWRPSRASRSTSRASAG